MIVVTAGILILLQLYHLTIPFMSSPCSKVSTTLLQVLGTCYQIVSINLYFEIKMNMTLMFSCIDQTIMIGLVLISAWYVVPCRKQNPVKDPDQEEAFIHNIMID